MILDGRKVNEWYVNWLQDFNEVMKKLLKNVVTTPD